RQTRLEWQPSAHGLRRQGQRSRHPTPTSLFVNMLVPATDRCDVGMLIQIAPLDFQSFRMSDVISIHTSYVTAARMFNAEVEIKRQLSNVRAKQTHPRVTNLAESAPDLIAAPVCNYDQLEVS